MSSCLLGEKVRFDGGHKRDRPTLRLSDSDAGIRLVTPKTGAAISSEA